MIVVYFEAKVGNTAEVIATFTDEEWYIECVPSLEDYAKKNGGFITESAG